MLANGTQLGPYKIVAPLGAGGMGEVYRARDVRLGREVALKILPERFAQDPDRLTRFEREARAVAALAHPNILVLHDIGGGEGVHYAVTELLEGETFRRCLARAPLPWRKAVEVAAAVADGLAAAHAKRIVHRDLKPENLFLTADGRVKILDFGLARVEGAELPPDVDTRSYSPGQTQPGAVLGTPGYMAPEQVCGQPADARSDLFAFGCVLYEMVSGRRPFAGSSEAEVAAAILHEDPPGLAGAGAKLPAELERLIRHCLEKNAEARFQSARDLAFALRALLSDSDVAKISAARPAARRGRRRKAVDSLAVLPLANAAADPDAEYVSDGLTESILFTLSRLPRLRVMARSTVFRYKGRDVDPQAVGRELGVQAVLTGRISVRGDTLTLAVELVDVADGAQLWGEQYRRRLSDILTVEEDVARQITENLRLQLSGAEKKRLVQQPTADTDAYRLYLQGRYYWNKRTEEGLTRGVACFDQAIAQDPGYALAYAGLADCYNNLGSYAFVPPREAFPRAKSAALKALELDPELAEAHVSLGFVRCLFDWDWAGARKAYRRALKLNPGYVTAHHWYAWYLITVGEWQEAYAEMERARELDPLSLPINTNLGFCHYFARQYDRAIGQFHKALEMEPTFTEAHRGLGLCYAETGAFGKALGALRKARSHSPSSLEVVAHVGYAHALAGKGDEARKVLRELEEAAARRYVSCYDRAGIHAALGELDPAFALLEQACGERSYALAWVHVDPCLDRLRPDPRFAEVLQRAGLAR
jgi:TolB-like protein/Tfp pilus assembly protein PilF